VRIEQLVGVPHAGAHLGLAIRSRALPRLLYVAQATRRNEANECQWQLSRVVNIFSAFVQGLFTTSPARRRDDALAR
jgi:hypothetical protein